MENNKRTIQDYLSLGYLFLILCGLAKDIIFYKYLGINILDYSSISDVLLSPISYIGENYVAAAFLIMLFPFIYLTHNRFRIWHNKYKDRKWYNMGMDMSKWDEYLAKPPSIENAAPLLAITIISFFLGTGLGGGSKVRDKIAENDYAVDKRIHFNDKGSVDVKIIGQNSQFLFYTTPDNPTIHVVPIQGNIKQIELLTTSNE